MKIKSLMKNRSIAIILLFSFLMTLFPIPAEAAATLTWSGGSKGNISISEDTTITLTAGTTTTVGTITVSNNATVTFTGTGTANITSIASNSVSGSDGGSLIIVANKGNINISSIVSASGATASSSRADGYNAGNIQISNNGASLKASTISSGNGSDSKVVSSTVGIPGQGGDIVFTQSAGTTSIDDITGGNGGKGQTGGTGGNISINLTGGTFSVTGLVSAGNGGKANVNMGSGGTGGSVSITSTGGTLSIADSVNGGRGGDPFTTGSSGSSTGAKNYPGDGGSITVNIKNTSGKIGSLNTGSSGEYSCWYSKTAEDTVYGIGNTGDLSLTLNSDNFTIPSSLKATLGIYYKATSSGGNTNYIYPVSKMGNVTVNINTQNNINLSEIMGGFVKINLTSPKNITVSKIKFGNYSTGAEPELSITCPSTVNLPSIVRLTDMMYENLDFRNVKLTYDGGNTGVLNLPSTAFNYGNAISPINIKAGCIFLKNATASSSGSYARTITSPNTVMLLDLTASGTKISGSNPRVVDLNGDILYKANNGSYDSVLIAVPDRRKVQVQTDTVVLVDTSTNQTAFTPTNSSAFNSTTETFNVKSQTLQKITFNANGGTLNSSNTQSSFTGGKIYEPNEPTRGGYIFEGWYQNSSGTGSAWDFSNDTVSGAMTLYAKWKPGPPSFTGLSKTPNDWTNGTVKLTVSAAAVEGTLKYSFDAGMNWQTDNFKYFDENIQLAANAVMIKDTAGTIVGYPASISIDNIDKTAPLILSVSKSTTEITDCVELIVNASDTESNIETYSFDGGVTWQTENFKSYTENTTLAANTIKVKDTAGNVATYQSKIVINNIGDMNLPIIRNVVFPTEWTNAEKIEISVEAEDDTGISAYSFDGGMTWQTSNKFTITENKTIVANTIQVQDSSNNVTKYPTAVTIACFDRNAPDSPTITNTGTNIFTITKGTDADSGIKEIEYFVIGGDEEWVAFTESSKTITLTGTQSLSARSVDNAGNVSEIVSIFGQGVEFPDFEEGHIISNTAVTIPVDTSNISYNYYYQIVNYGNSYSDNGWQAITNSQILVDKAEGHYEVGIKMTAKGAENISKVEVTIDKTAPLILSVSKSTTEITDSLEVIVSALDMHTDIEAYSFDAGLTWQTEECKTFNTPAPIPSRAIQVKDLAGNIYAYPSKVLLGNVIDSIPPTITNVIVPSEWTNADSVNITVEANDDIAMNTAAFSFDGGVTWQEDNSYAYHENQTIHANTIQVKDASNNITMYETEIVINVLDWTAPDAPTIIEHGTNTNTFEITAGIDTESGVARTEYYIIGGDSDWTSFTEASKTVTIIGTQSLSARSVDNAGNISEVVTVFGNNLVLPEFSNRSIISNQPIIIDVDTSQAVFNYEYQVVEHGEDYHTSNWISLTGSKINLNNEGYFDVYIRISEAISGLEIISKVEAILDMTVPDIVSASKSTEEMVEELDLIITAEDSLSGIESYSFDGGFSWQMENVKHYDFYSNSNIPAGNIQVKDIAGNIASLQTDILLDNIKDLTAPVIKEVIMQNSWTNADSVSIMVEANDDIAINTLGFSFDAGNSWQEENYYTYYDNQIIAPSTIQVKDDAGNVTTYNKEIVISCFDRVAPTAPIITPVEEELNTFKVAHGLDSESGVDKTEYYIVNNIDNGNWTIVISADEKIIIGGKETMVARTVDKAGNVSEISYAFGNEISLPSHNGENIISNEPVVIPVETTDEFTYSYQVVPYGETAGTEWSEFDGTSQDIFIEEEGHFDVNIKVEEEVSQLEYISNVDVIVDMTAPSAPYIEVCSEDLGTMVVVTAGEDLLSGIDKTTVTLNGEEWEPDDTSAIVQYAMLRADASTREIIVPTTYTLRTPGEYLVEAFSYDKAGNQSQISSQQITIEDESEEEAPPEELPEEDEQEPEEEEQLPEEKPDKEKVEIIYGGSSIPWGSAERLKGTDKNGRSYILNEGITVNEEALVNGYIAGYADGTFRPNGEITRGEFAAILSRLINFESNSIFKPTPYYSDVDKHWAEANISTLQRHNVIPVDNKMYFKPNEAITREEVVAALYNILNLNDYGVLTKFSDIADSEYSSEIGKIYNAGIIAGYPDGKFYPESTITRAEVVCMLNRVFGLQKLSIRPEFSDIKYTAWYYQDVINAAKN